MPDEKRGQAFFVRIYSEDSDEFLLGELGCALNQVDCSGKMELHYQVPLSLVEVSSPVLEGVIENAKSLLEVTMEFLRRRKLRMKIEGFELEFPHYTTEEALLAMDKMHDIIMVMRKGCPCETPPPADKPH